MLKERPLIPTARHEWGLVVIGLYLSFGFFIAPMLGKSLDEPGMKYQCNPPPLVQGPVYTRTKIANDCEPLPLKEQFKPQIEYAEAIVAWPVFVPELYQLFSPST